MNPTREECQQWWAMIRTPQNRKKIIVFKSWFWNIYVNVQLWHANDFDDPSYPSTVEAEVGWGIPKIRTFALRELTKSTLFTSSEEAVDFAASMNELEGLG